MNHREENKVEQTEDGIGENETQITNPFSTKDIKITNAQILLPPEFVS